MLEDVARALISRLGEFACNQENVTIATEDTCAGMLGVYAVILLQNVICACERMQWSITSFTMIFIFLGNVHFIRNKSNLMASLGIHL